MKQGVVITSGLQNWQILQQQSGSAHLKIAGWFFVEALPGNTPVEISARVVHEDTGATVIDWLGCVVDGLNWYCNIERIPAGGLYRLETVMQYPNTNGLSITRGDMIHHFGVGDVFLIAGQSNASGRAKDEAFDPPELGVHLLRNSGNWDLATHPFNETTNSIYPQHYEPGNPAHCAFLSFGRLMKAALGYPIGFLQSAKGGSGLWQWNPDEEGTLYFEMIEMVRKYSPRLRAVLWYQGCADAFEIRGGNYLERFSNMVNRTRSDLGMPDLPFVTVQLNRCTMETSPENDASWGLIREKQRISESAITNLCTVPSNDLPLFDVVHLSAAGNVELGVRIAEATLGLLGERPARAAPDVESATLVSEREIRVHFNGVENKLSVGSAVCFTLEDASGLHAPTGFELERDSITLVFDRPISGEAKLHYQWQMNPPTEPMWDEGRVPALSFYGISVERE